MTVIESFNSFVLTSLAFQNPLIIRILNEFFKKKQQNKRAQNLQPITLHIHTKNHTKMVWVVAKQIWVRYLQPSV